MLHHRHLLCAALLCACASFALLPRGAAAQDPLPFIPASSSWANDLARQADGKVVVAGQAGGAVALARYTATGQLDPTFGLGGRVLTPFQQAVYSAALAIQPDGKIVVTSRANAAIVVLRYTLGGRLDPSFGVEGVVLTPLGADSGGNALVLQPDGKIVVAGYAGDNVALVRYTPSGQLDRTFGTRGKAITSFGPNTSVNALVRQSDGKLVVAGSVDEDIFLMRYKADGSLDTSFNTGGIVITDFGYGERAADLALQSDGKLVVTGSTIGGSGLVRYTASGQLDPSFGNGGRTDQQVFQTVYDAAYTLAIRPDGRIIVAGLAAGFCFCNIPASDIALAQFLPNGMLDPSFGYAGRVLENLTPYNDAVAALVLESNGSMLVAGSTGGYAGTYSSHSFVVGRFTDSGAVDSSFGMHITQFPLPARAYLPQARRQ